MRQGLYDIIEFSYVYREGDDKDFLYILEESEKKYVAESEVRTAKLYIKTPSWYEAHEISRLSSDTNPYTYEKIYFEEKIKENKIKILAWKIEDCSGDTYYVDDKFVEEIKPELAIFILNKIDELLYSEGCYDTFSEEEMKKLSHDCLKYYSAVKRRSHGKTGNVPTPPAVVILATLCETFSCTPDKARKIAKKDIDGIWLAREQQDIAGKRVDNEAYLEEKRKAEEKARNAT